MNPGHFITDYNVHTVLLCTALTKVHMSAIFCCS